MTEEKKTLKERIGEKRKEAKEGTEDKARTLRNSLQGQAQDKFIRKVMKEDGLDYNEAWARCTGNSETRYPELILGYRLSDPLMIMALYMQGMKNREKAAANFRKTLADEPDILALFDQEYKGLGKTFVEAMKEGRGKA